MEEKKLTDEKSMFNYIANDILGQVKPLYLRKRIVTEIFDLIHSLQSENAKQKAEIKRLTEKPYKHEEKFYGFKSFIARLFELVRENKRFIAFDGLEQDEFNDNWIVYYIQYED